MKIGILTFCNAYNLGAALQSYSLQKKLQGWGNEVELIDYRCPAIENMHKFRHVLRPGMRLKLRMYNLLFNLIVIRRRCRYRHFRRDVQRSKLYTRDTIAETNGSYDLFISGSDQVFNLLLTKGDHTYYLDFVEKGIKASYAASLGVCRPGKDEEYQKQLLRFDFLSVREKSTQDYFQAELGVAAELMPDPVFLFTGDEWKALLDIKEKKKKDRYLLIYCLPESRKLYQMAHEAAEKKGLKIYVITKEPKAFGRADRTLTNIGPREFLELLANADYVVTNSFHDTAFSLIFHKEFSILVPDYAPERVTNLLEYAGQTDRAVYDSSQIRLDPMDYSDTQLRLEEMRQKGMAYLRKIGA